MKTILIVDDHEADLYQLHFSLNAEGYHVLTARNGAEALEIARQQPPDLVISDILMPVMDGFMLCREWMKDERLRSIPFIFYTATYTEDRDRELALQLGARRFLVKPPDHDAFVRLLREVRRKRPWRRSNPRRHRPKKPFSSPSITSR